MRSENESSGQVGRTFIEEARRKQIIAAAVDVLAEVGYGKASLARIAARAGISKGVISYHFDGKDDLMHQVVIQLYVSGGEYMRPRIDAVTGHREKLMTYLESNLQFIADNRKYIAAMSDVVVNFRDADGALKFASEGGAEVAAPLVRLLEEGQRSGDFRKDFSAAVMAGIIRDAIDGAARRCVRDAAWDMNTHREEMCRLFDIATAGGDGPGDSRRGKRIHER